MAVMVSRHQALIVATKKIRCLPVKTLESNLDHFCGSFAEAYQCGVEEAQGEIISRLMELPVRLVEPKPIPRLKIERSATDGGKEHD